MGYRTNLPAWANAAGWNDGADAAGCGRKGAGAAAALTPLSICSSLSLSAFSLVFSSRSSDFSACGHTLKQ